MGGGVYRRLTLLLTSLQLLLTLNLAIAQSTGLVNITGCSESQLNFTLAEETNMNSRYWFLAACKDNNGTCVDHESELPRGMEPTLGSTFKISVGPSCTLSKLSPNGTGLCTLLISTSNIIYENTGIAFSTTCTLPTVSSVVSSQSVQTPGDSNFSTSVESSPTGTAQPDSTSVVVAIIISVLVLLLILVVIIAIISLLMWMRHSQIRSRGTLYDQKDVLKASISFLMGSNNDDIDGDNITQYEIIVLDEGGVGSRTDLSVLNGLKEGDDCSKDSSYVKAPISCSSGYVAGIMSQGALYEQNDTIKPRISSQTDLDSDIIAGDNITLRDSIVCDEREVGSRTDLFVPNALKESDACPEGSSCMKVPLPSSSGYVAGIQYTNTQQ